MFSRQPCIYKTILIALDIIELKYEPSEDDAMLKFKWMNNRCLNCKHAIALQWKWIIPYNSEFQKKDTFATSANIPEMTFRGSVNNKFGFNYRVHCRDSSLDRVSYLSIDINLY